MTKEQAINYLTSSGFTEEQIKEIVNALDQRMSEIVMYKEIVKAVHNQYIDVITELEDALHKGYLSGIIPRVNNVGIENNLSIMHATINTVRLALRISCDAAIEIIESEEE